MAQRACISRGGCLVRKGAPTTAWPEHPPAPDRDALGASAAALAARPDFDAAARAFCDGMIGFYGDRWVRNTALGYALGFAISALVIHLDSTRPGGATTARLTAICQAGGLAGARAVRGAVGVLRAAGLIEARRDPEDRRAWRLAPTSALLDLMRENLATRLEAQAPLTPFPQPAAAWARTPGVLEAFLGGNVEAFAGAGFRLDADTPEVRAFMDPQCGYLVLLALVQASLGGEAWTLSAMARRFDVSRAHIRKLLAVGQARGWLVGGGGATPALSSEAREKLRLWIGREFAWTAHLVAQPTALTSPAGR